jgi:hypothetical protein
MALGAGATASQRTRRRVRGARPSSQDSSASGVTKWVKENLALRLDGRYRWTDVNGDEDFYCDPYFGGCYSYDTSWYGSGEITGGFTYQF